MLVLILSNGDLRLDARRWSRASDQSECTCTSLMYRLKVPQAQVYYSVAAISRRYSNNTRLGVMKPRSDRHPV